MIGDDTLLARVANQDREAFHRLYERYADSVYRYALSILRSPHLAEDVLQETMAAVWRSAGRFAGRSKVSTWILGITRNQAHNLLRAEIKGRRLPADDPTSVPADPTRSLHVDLRVRQALETLPAAQHEVMHLVFYEHLSVREAADLLDVPTGTVKSRMHAARQALAKELA